MNDYRTANAAVFVAALMFAMSLAAGIPLFMFYSLIALFLAGALVGFARQAEPKRARVRVHSDKDDSRFR
jgi:cell division protein FtsW (lipid II flippase)